MKVWRFFEELENLPRWDRSVQHVEWTSGGPGRLGSTFDTVGDRGRGRMSYRVAAVVEPSYLEATTDTGYFKTARWRFTLADADSGTLVTCTVDFVLRRRYALLAVLLRLTASRALRRDLDCLKRVIEGDSTDQSDRFPTGEHRSAPRS